MQQVNNSTHSTIQFPLEIRVLKIIIVALIGGDKKLSRGLAVKPYRLLLS
jgi:hypothetical protein